MRCRQLRFRSRRPGQVRAVNLHGCRVRISVCGVNLPVLHHDRGEGHRLNGRIRDFRHGLCRIGKGVALGIQVRHGLGHCGPLGPVNPDRRCDIKIRRVKNRVHGRCPDVRQGRTADKGCLPDRPGHVRNDNGRQAAVCEGGFRDGHNPFGNLHCRQGGAARESIVRNNINRRGKGHGRKRGTAVKYMGSQHGNRIRQTNLDQAGILEGCIPEGGEISRQADLQEADTAGEGVVPDGFQGGRKADIQGDQGSVRCHGCNIRKGIGPDRGHALSNRNCRNPVPEGLPGRLVPDEVPHGPGPVDIKNSVGIGPGYAAAPGPRRPIGRSAITHGRLVLRLGTRRGRKHQPEGQHAENHGDHDDDCQQFLFHGKTSLPGSGRALMENILHRMRRCFFSYKKINGQSCKCTLCVCKQP